jgi:hypothetical protein
MPQEIEVTATVEHVLDVLEVSVNGKPLLAVHNKFTNDTVLHTPKSHTTKADLIAVLKRTIKQLSS